MFNKEKNPTSPERLSSNSATLISAGTVLEGNVQSDNDLRIDGTILGNVSCAAKIIVGPNGYVEGDVQGMQADITGKVTGNITVKELLQLRDQSNVQGNITASRLQIDPTAMFNGLCQMGTQADVVQMSANAEAQAN